MLSSCWRQISHIFSDLRQLFALCSRGRLTLIHFVDEIAMRRDFSRENASFSGTAVAAAVTFSARCVGVPAGRERERRSGTEGAGGEGAWHFPSRETRKDGVSIIMQAVQGYLRLLLRACNISNNKRQLTVGEGYRAATPLYLHQSLRS